MERNYVTVTLCISLILRLRSQQSGRELRVCVRVFVCPSANTSPELHIRSLSIVSAFSRALFSLLAVCWPGAQSA